MIKDQQSFEDALERATYLLSLPPISGTREDAELCSLLQQIERYLPSMTGAAPRDAAFSELAARSQDLLKRALAFQRRHDDAERRSRISSYPEDGRGIGPTTGV